jgi:murein DD-endopeptidase MepM/ murein hydrolase activator NlpD
MRLDSDARPPAVFAVPEDVPLASTHTILEGETLYDVAYIHNVDPANLASINGLKAPYRLKPDQVLRLPDNHNNDYVSRGSSTVTMVDPELIPLALEEGRRPNKKIAPEEYKEEEGEKKIEIVAFDAPQLLESQSAPVKPAAAPAQPKDEQISVPNSGKKTAPKENDDATAAASTAAVRQISQPKIVKPAVDVGARQSRENGKLIWPLKGKIISNFGDIIDGSPNDGINIKPSNDTQVRSIDSGTVIYSGNKLEEDFGNVVIVQHSSGLITSYAHLHSTAVKDGDRVAAGDVVGRVGKSGNVAEPQLHFEVMKDKKPVNPVKFLEKQ